MILAFDFDGTIAEERDGRLALRDGAAEGLRRLAAAGHRLVLHSCRSTDPADAARIEGRPPPTAAEVAEHRERNLEMWWLLESASVQTLLLEWEGRGKPPADLYVDDLSWSGRIDRPGGWRALVEVFGA